MKTTDEIFGLLASGFEASRDEKDQDFDPDRPLGELIADKKERLRVINSSMTELHLQLPDDVAEKPTLDELAAYIQSRQQS
ncbi:hypothetical protein G9Q86_02700 [Pseudomonas sp. CCUG 57209]|uniref:hypothetical protein n=1 Tax=Pseudomonas sivasensis TaxID=1880678 RepID=UPI0015EB766D|nr:hypothetical protein [Pseudomonas sivasensis]MBA2927468.1 hypothetical protein [Pseudomonas sivasensis]